MGILQARIPEWVTPCPTPGDLSNPGIEPRSPSLRVYSSPSEPPEKPECLSNSYYNAVLYWTSVRTAAKRSIRTVKRITLIFKVKLSNSNENFCFYFKVCDILFSVRGRLKTFALKPDLVLQTIYSLKYWIEKLLPLLRFLNTKVTSIREKRMKLNKLETSDDMLFFFFFFYQLLCYQIIAVIVWNIYSPKVGKHFLGSPL